MKTLELGSTGLKTSSLVLGTMTFGGQVDADAARVMVDLAAEAGVQHIDTANSYQEGRSEEILGEILLGRREEFVLASKVFNPHGPAPEDRGLRARAIVTAVEASLRRLRTDHLDLYYLHQPDWDVPLEESLAAMAALVTAGKVGSVAASNYAAWQLVEAQRLAEQAGRATITVSQVMLNLLARDLEDEYAAAADDKGWFSIVYNPLAGGLLTGKHRLDSAPADGSRFTGAAYRDRYWNDQQFAAVDALTAIADQAGIGLVELSLRWTLHHPTVGAVLLGASSPAQLLLNLAASDGGPLPTDVLNRCDEVWAQLRGPAPRYNR
ncbi:MAG: aldo/keto reductase [Janthinobacterium lividum]